MKTDENSNKYFIIFIIFFALYILFFIGSIILPSQCFFRCDVDEKCSCISNSQQYIDPFDGKSKTD